MANGGSKFFTGLFSFIFGFLFGIIVIIGAVAGVAIYAVTADFEDIFELAGIDNRDENGDYKYVNTGVEGISNALDLIEKLQEFSKDPMNLTLGEIDYYLPVTGGIVESIAKTFEDHGVVVDIESLNNTKFSELSHWFIDTIYSVEISSVISKHHELEDITHTGVAGADKMFDLVIYGKEIQYVINGNEKYEVYTDTYILTENGYKRVADGEIVSLDKAHWMFDERVQIDGTFYSVNYYNANGGWYVTDEDLTYTANDASAWSYSAYSSEVKGSAGDYYVDNNGKRVIINPITVGTLVSSGYLTGLLNDLHITDFVSDSGNEIIGELLGGVTLGAILDQKIDFDKIINGAELGVLLGDVKATDAIMVYLIYGVTNVTPNDDGTYSGTYYPLDEKGYQVEGEPAVEVTITVDDNDFIQSITINGEEKAGTTVGQINGLVSGVMDVLAISDLLDISDSSIMAYIGYGLSGMEEVEGKEYQYTGKIKIVNENGEPILDGEGNETFNIVYIKAEDGKIVGVYSDAALTQPVSGTKIGDISNIIDGITEDLYIKDIIDIDPEDDLMVKLGDYKISEIGDALDEIVLSDVMDIEIDNNIMVYMAYGVKGVEEISGEGYTHKATYIHIDENENKTEYECYINTETAENGDVLITEVWYYGADGERLEVEGTAVNGVGDRVDGVTEDLCIKDIIDIDPEDKLMVKLGEYPIDQIGDAIDEIVLSDVMDIEIDNNIMVYMAYGVKGVEEISGEGYTHKATYIHIDENEIKTEYECYINTEIAENGDVLITEVWYYGAYGEQVVVDGTPVNGVGDRVDGITEDLLIKDIIEIDPEDKLMVKLGGYAINDISTAIDDILLSDVIDVEIDNAIMAYMGYGITDITKVDEFNYNANYIHVGENDVKTSIPCNVTVDEKGVITKVWYEENGEEVVVDSTAVNAINGRVDGITEDLKVKDVIDIDPDDKFMNKLGDYQLNNIGSAVDDLELADFMEVEIKDNGNIMAYVTYGLKDITAVSNEEYDYVGTIDGETVYITVDENKKITGVYSDAALQTLKEGTKVNNVNDRVDGIMEDLTLGEIIEIDESNTMLNALSDTTVNNISNRIATLSIQELYAKDIYGTTSLTEVTSATFKSENIYYVLENGKYVYVNNEDDEHRGKLAAFDTENTYYTYGEAVGVWKFMLYGNNTEKLYTVNDMGELMNNTTANIGEATLYDLADAGIIAKSSLYQADGVTPKVINVPGVINVEMGELTISGLIDVVGMIGGTP